MDANGRSDGRTGARLCLISRIGYPSFTQLVRPSNPSTRMLRGSRSSEQSGSGGGASSSAEQVTQVDKGPQSPVSSRGVRAAAPITLPRRSATEEDAVDLRIRDATEADLPAIVDIYN